MHTSKDNSLQRIDELVEKLKVNCTDFSNTYSEAYPDASISEAHETYMFNKIATLTIAMEELGKRILELERK